MNSPRRQAPSKASPADRLFAIRVRADGRRELRVLLSKFKGRAHVKLQSWHRGFDQETSHSNGWISIGADELRGLADALILAAEEIGAPRAVEPGFKTFTPTPATRPAIPHKENFHAQL